MFKKRFISILALLCLTVSGAWAQEVTLLTTIESTGDNASFKSGSKTFDNIATVTFSGNVLNDGDEWGWFSESECTLTVTAAEGYTITRVKFYTDSSSAFDEEYPFEAILVNDYGYFAKVNGNSIGEYGVTKIEVYGYAGTPEPATVAVTGVTLAPTSATLTLGETETVTLIPTVLPDDATDKSVTWSSSNEAVATVTDGVVTAVAAGTATITVTTTDGAKTATCAVTVAEPTYTVTVKEGTEDATNWQGKAGEGEYQALPLTGVAAGTAVSFKYSGTKHVKSVKAKRAAPANVPVESITLNKTATEIAVGQTETLSVTEVLPANATDPTYTWKTSDETKATVDQDGKVTAVAAGNVNIYAEANDGSGVSATCAVTVTLTYPIALSAVTADYIGSVITSDGNVYPAKTAVPAGKTAVAMIAYVDGENHGLAIALADEGSMTWSTAKSTCEGKAAIGGNSWKLPSQEEWKNMFSANGSNQGSYSGLNTAITTAGGTALQGYGDYWSSSEGDDNDAWYVGLIEGGAYWSCDYKDANYQARACFAF